MNYKKCNQKLLQIYLFLKNMEVCKIIMKKTKLKLILNNMRLLFNKKARKK